MKKLLLAFVTLLSISAFAQDGDLNLVAEDGAEINFAEETLDYGTIENGSDGTRYFTFYNDGKEPLIITNCKGSCGCTVPQCPKEPVLPGDSAQIKVKYDTKRTGNFTKSVTVSSNATNAPSKVVKIKGNVLPVATTESAE
ncbi:MAG: DUF1573 domain-containing protein [Chitinophagales bacterium]